MNAGTIAQPTLIDALWPQTSAQRVLRLAVLALLGSALLALSAKVKVPFHPVPMTMQTFAVLVIGAGYGWRLGLATVLLYLAEGAAGLPVFTDTPEKGIGLAYMLGPTGGYLIGFAAGAAATGYLAEHGWGRSPGRLFIAMAIGHAVIFAFGVAWLAFLIGPAKAWSLGVAPFYLATLLKTALGTAAIWGAWTLTPSWQR